MITDLEKYNRLMFVGGLLGYLEIRHWALSKISTASFGSDAADFRMHHYLYFANLFEAIDFVRDYLEQELDGAFDAEVRKGFAVATDYAYARGLRNSVVHRGLDPTMMGSGRGDFIVAVCPPVVHDGRGKNLKSYGCSVPALVDLAELCDRAANPAILAVLDQDQLLDVPANTINQTETLAMMCASTHIPDFVKAGAPQAFASMDFEAMAAEIALSRTQRIQALLGRV